MPEDDRSIQPEHALTSPLSNAAVLHRLRPAGWVYDECHF
jgi:hypothetical protein